jgi:hypothetical protein
MNDANALRAGRRLTDPQLAGAADSAAQAETPVAPAGKKAAPEPDLAAGPFEAQLIGQDGQKRGLKGGKPVLDRARSTYLGTEWSGPADRRPPMGLLTRTKV